MTSLCHVNDLSPGEILAVEVEGIGAVAVYNVDGTFYATDGMCSHGEASLAEGEIDGAMVICLMHMGSFDIATGKAINAPCYVDIKSYPVEIVGDEVRIRKG